MVIMKRLGVVLILVLGVAAVVLYDPLPDNPSYEVLVASANDYHAEVVRDEWGVPHIQGERDADTSFALAYAHAEDDYETIQEVLAATRGVLARYRGAGAAPTDYVVSFLGVWETVAEHYEAIPAHVKAIAEAYAAGLNLYAAEHPEQTWRGLAPFKGEDVVAGFIFKTPFFYGLDKTLAALFEENRVAELALDPAVTGQAFTWHAPVAAQRGSNAMAVSADRSGEGVTRLLINSHQPMTGPVAWYEAHIRSNEGLDIQGGIFPGTPVILHGFNRHLGWANTVNHIDLSDVYRLTLNPENPKQYELDGQWHDFDHKEMVIKVHLWGPFTLTARRDLWLSKHGPVVKNGDNALALRYAGRGEHRQLEQYYRLNQATDFDGFMRAMAMNALPSINYVYADKDDNIAFIHNAQYPNRIEGWDWSKDLPGDRSDLIWQGYRDFDAVPKLINPQSGLLFNANNTPFSATDGADNLRAESFPPSMGLATNQTNRALRLTELNDGITQIDKSTLLAQKFDLSYSTQSAQYAIVQTLINADWSKDEGLAEAARHLSEWDLSTDQANRHAALGALVFMQLAMPSDPSAVSLSELETPFRTAVDYLKTRYGRIDPTWGEVLRLVRGEVDLPLSGGPDVLRAIYSIGTDDVKFATHGDTWMALVEWQNGELMNADVVHQFGSATLDSASIHYADQAPLFVNQEWRTARFDFEQIRANASRRYTLGAPEPIQ